ncbi:MAG: methionyl-tRNA formyltransferase [Epsilonproteobacteria bacterium]|nr:methionyl-tRNA formyltransferase [Campylobacterota bacterium]
MRVVFMGTPNYAVEILKELVKHTQLLALYTQPDKPVGRKQVLTPPATKEFLQKNYPSIPIHQELEVDSLKKYNPDFIVVAAYGKILPKEVLKIAPSINLHASLLPKYRGASPIQQALLEGEKITGVTAMLMDEGLDTGDILGYLPTPIAPKELAKELFERLAKLASKLTLEVLNNFSIISPLPQANVDATYCKKIKKEDCLSDFSNAIKLFNKYRAFHLWPGVCLESGLKLKKVDLFASEGEYREGIILEILEDESVIVGCKEGALKIERVQPPSKKEMSAKAYLQGRRLKVGDSFF